MAERVPPGRTGRLWLMERLAVARRGEDLLDRKRQLLRFEQQRLTVLCDRAERVWHTACAAAEQWGLRVAVLGGDATALRTARALAGPATVEISWGNTMGVRLPGAAACTLPVLAPAEVAAGNSAVGPAASAYRRALEAAAAYAVAAAAKREVEAELRATQRRLRAIERHRIPRLESSLHDLALRLEELEREERVVTRWAYTRREKAQAARAATEAAASAAARPAPAAGAEPTAP